MSLLEMSISGGALILTAVLIRALGRDRLPRQTFTALWTLAVLRLTVPARLPFRLSAWTLIRKAISHAASSDPLPAVVTAGGQATLSSVDMIQAAPLSGTAMPFPTMTVVWLIGAALCTLALAAVYIRGRRSFRTALPADSAFVEEWLRAHPLRRTVRVRVSDRIAAPLTYGMLRPVILLPRSMDLEDGQTLGYVLAHELAHIRRFDAVRKLILAAVLCLHWFNPLVWVMFVLAGRDMELCCDEAVLRAMGPDARKEYAHILLDMEQVRGGFTGLASGFSRTATEERIRSIMKNRKRSFLSVALALVLVLGTGGLFATAAPEPEAEQDSRDMLANAGTGAIDPENDEADHTTGEDIQWWTAGEYATWLEQEKQDLQDCLGQRAWTRSDGWFTWTQEKIDETIEMYEQVLEDIQNGLLVSKPLADGALLYEGADTAVQFSSGADTEEEQARWTGEREQADAPASLAVSYRVSPPEAVADGPYDRLETGGRVRVAEVPAAQGSTVSVGVQTRTDAALTVSLHGGAGGMGESVDLKAGQMQTVTFHPEDDDTYVLHLTNNSEGPVDFTVSYAVS